MTKKEYDELMKEIVWYCLQSMIDSDIQRTTIGISYTKEIWSV